MSSGGEERRAARRAERRAEKDAERMDRQLRKQQRIGAEAQAQARKLAEAQAQSVPKKTDAEAEKGISRKKRRPRTGVASLRIIPMQGSSTNIG